MIKIDVYGNLSDCFHKMMRQNVKKIERNYLLFFSFLSVESYFR